MVDLGFGPTMKEIPGTHEQSSMVKSKLFLQNGCETLIRVNPVWKKGAVKTFFFFFFKFTIISKLQARLRVTLER